jgi:hypothetical protein
MDRGPSAPICAPAGDEVWPTAMPSVRLAADPSPLVGSPARAGAGMRLECRRLFYSR